MLYDKLEAIKCPLVVGVDVAGLGKPRPKEAKFGLPKDRFGTSTDEASFVADANTVTEIRLPAALFAGREFVVDGRAAQPLGDRVVQVRIFADGAARAEVARMADARWDGVTPILASPTGAGYKRLCQGNADFRRVFPLFLCFPAVVPTDEVVSLKMFHREDEPLGRLFLDADQRRRLDRLWVEHRFISRQPEAENNY